MWEQFRRLRSEIYKDADDLEETCFVIDAGIAELLKWKRSQNEQDVNGTLINVVNISTTSVQDLVDDLLLINPGSIIVWLSFIEETVLVALREALKKANIFECAVVSHYNSASLKVALRCEEDGEDYLRSALQPIVPKLFFSPTYSFPILHEPAAFEFRIATCHRDRHVHSLTYSSLAKTSDNNKCIHDITAADLPTDIKQSLKHLAHNVAGSVICELGLDVSDSMFAMGKTASLIGHSMLTMFDGYHDLRTAMSTNPSTVAVDPTAFAKKRSTTTNTVAPLQPASLILVDRIEDLFTPILMGGDQPVLHRVLNAIKTDAVQAHTLASSHESSTEDSPSDDDDNDDDDAEVLVDIALKPDWLRALHTAEDDSSADGPPQQQQQQQRTDTAVSSPMNGVSTLAVHHVPSICHLTSDGVLPALMTESEDVGRGRLVDALKQHIRDERGTLPPAKKRGIGAEILALVQSLLKAPGKEAPVVTDGNPVLAPAVRTQSLLAIAATVIETMQRSSAKQFSSVCAWKAALDTRISRESDWQKVLASAEFSLDSTDAELIAAAMAVTQRPLHRTLTTTTTAGGTSSGEVDGPTDVSQILLLTVGLMGFMRFRTTTLDFLQPLAEALAQHLLLFASDDELRYLRHLGLLTTAMDEIVAEARFEGLDAATMATDGSYTFSTLTTLVGQRFAVLRELETMHRHVLHRVVAKKVAESKNLPWDTTAASTTSGSAAATSSSSGGSGSVGVGGGGSGGAAHEFDRMAEQVLQGTHELHYLRHCFRADAPGLLAKVLEDCMVYHRTRQSSPLSLLLEHVQSPFQQMKNTGLELLSKGLGSWGFGLSRVVKAVTEAPHPGAHRTVVLFVLGGITYKEVAQLRAVLEQQLQLDRSSGEAAAAVPWRVIVWTNRTISSEEVLATLFRPIAVGASAPTSAR